MRLLVVGAAGRVGRLVVDEALPRRHQVTALVRSPEKLGDAAGLCRVVRGDALDPAAVASAIVGQDAVLYVLGAGKVRTTTLFRSPRASCSITCGARACGGWSV